MCQDVINDPRCSCASVNQQAQMADVKVKLERVVKENER